MAPKRPQIKVPTRVSSQPQKAEVIAPSPLRTEVAGRDYPLVPTPTPILATKEAGAPSPPPIVRSRSALDVEGSMSQLEKALSTASREPRTVSFKAFYDRDSDVLEEGGFQKPDPNVAIGTVSLEKTLGIGEKQYDFLGMQQMIINNVSTAQDSKSYLRTNWIPIDAARLKIIITPEEPVAMATSDFKYSASVIQTTKAISTEPAQGKGPMVWTSEKPFPFATILTGKAAPTFGEAVENLFSASVAHTGAYVTNWMRDPRHH